MSTFYQYLMENMQASPLKTAVLDAYTKLESISIPESLCREAHEYIAATRGWRPDQAKRLYPANRDWLQSNASAFLSAYDATQDIASAVSAINMANGHPVTSRF